MAVVPTIVMSFSISSCSLSIFSSLFDMDVKASLYLTFHSSNYAYGISLYAHKSVLNPVAACFYKAFCVDSLISLNLPEPSKYCF